MHFVAFPALSYLSGWIIQTFTCSLLTFVPHSLREKSNSKHEDTHTVKRHYSVILIPILAHICLSTVVKKSPTPKCCILHSQVKQCCDRKELILEMGATVKTVQEMYCKHLGVARSSTCLQDFLWYWNFKISLLSLSGHKARWSEPIRNWEFCSKSVMNTYMQQKSGGKNPPRPTWP